jgi:hypothetical protein
MASCAPELNWREARLPSGTYEGMLPCKQEPSAREVELAGMRMRMSQLSCRAANATFTLAEASPIAPHSKVEPVNMEADSQQALNHWRHAVLRHMGVQESAVVVSVRPPATGSALASAVPILAAPILSASASRPGSQAPMALTAVWYAKGPRVYHAAVYAEGLAPQQQAEVREFFFGNLKVSSP